MEERQGLCAAAAAELARRQRNSDLLRRIGEWREEEMLWLESEKTDVAMTTEQVDEVIRPGKGGNGISSDPCR